MVRLDAERCVRCMACTVACPFGNMHFDRRGSLVHKCDLCPAAATTRAARMFCPTECLQVEKVGPRA